MTQWFKSPLGNIAELCLGKMLDEQKNKGDLLPYLANVNVRWSEFDLEGLREMRFAHNDLERYGLKFGDIVMCEGGEPGRCAIWKESTPGMMIQKALHRIRPRACLDYRYLFYFFLNTGKTGAFAPLFTGATIKHLPKQSLSKLAITYPPLDMQGRIAEILSTYDDLIENNRRRMALLEESARLLYREWFVRLRFPGYEHTPIADGVPQGWERKTLESVCQAKNGIQTGPFGSQLHQADYSAEGVPVVMPKDLIDFRVSTASIARIPEGLADALGRHRMAPGDTVYGRRGDIGRRAFIGKRQQGWFCGTGSLRIRPDTNAINALYLFDYLGTPAAVGDITNRAKGSTMLNLSAAALKPVPVFVPSRTLQEMYAEQVEQVREMVEVLDEQNQKLRTARDLLLPRLMSGAITV
jgi:type I restriction enzyme S subunit